MSIMRLLEFILIVLLLRALFPFLVRLVRKGPSRDRTTAERYKEEQFDEKKMDIEDGEFKELK